MKTDETNPKEFERGQTNEFSHIKGWGVDADPKNDPTFPIKKRTDEEHKGYDWDRPEQQPQKIEVLRSVERPNITAAFGTSMPPSGLSGIIRRIAYKFSESSYARWLPLILADRVNEIEGVGSDLKKGRFPNILAEHGWNAEWKHNRKSVVRKAVIAGVVTTAVVALVLAAKSKKTSSHSSST